MTSSQLLEPSPTTPRPWDGVKRDNLPGYWFLASLGKKVLRPGGIELTRQMLKALDITEEDSVVEYAPGLGITAQLALEKNPRSYLAVERDEAAAQLLNEKFRATPETRRCLSADASDPIPLPDASATVIYGESMMTIHTEEEKERIVNEVHRLLKPGGRYAMQELSVTPDDIPADEAEALRRVVMHAVRHLAWPKTTGQWKAFMEDHGFEVIAELRRPALLLEAERLIEDEGEATAFQFVWNVLEDDAIIARVREMRNMFVNNQKNLVGYCIVCRKR